MKRSTTYRTVTEKLYTYIVYLFVIAGLIPFLWIVFDLLRKGLPHFSIEFFTELWPDSLKAILATKSGESVVGGIANALGGSILITGIGILMAMPVGIIAGIGLFENNGKRFFKIIKTFTELLYGTPAIIISIAIYIWIVLSFYNFSALAGGSAVGIIMLPIITHYTYRSLKKESSAIKEAGVALGGSNFQILRKVLFSSALEGIISGAFYAICDAFGKVSPLLFTVLFASTINWNPLESSATLPMLLWNNYELSYLSDLLWPAALVLCAITFLFNFFARKANKKYKRKNTNYE